MKSKLIPIVQPSQFNDYLFAGWQSPVFGFYEKFHVERIENYKSHLQLPTPPHRRSVYFLVYITEGKALRNKGLSQYEVLPNHFFFLPADQITTLEKVAEETKGYYCHFTPEIFNQAHIKVNLAKDFPFFQLNVEPLVMVPDANRIGRLFDLLIEEYQQNKIDRFELIPLYLVLLFSEVKLSGEQHAHLKQNTAAHITQSYKNALSEFIYEKKSVAEFAEYLSISPNHLHKCVKATTGKSAHDLLDDMRILEAKVLLRQTKLSIGEIAFKIGKFDPSDFSRFFKLKTHSTPFDYRTTKV